MDVAWKPIALLIVGVALLSVPVFAPPANVLEHDTASTATEAENVSDMGRYSYAIYHYGNLSERAQTLYVQTLESDGKYTVPIGEGAPEFQYPTEEEINQHQDNLSKALSIRTVVIVRPNDSSLPPADENEGHQRIELMATYERPPDRLSEAYLPQYFALVAGLCLIGIGGYLQFGRPGDIGLRT